MRYMTIGDVIAYVDGIKSNGFTGAVKTVWLNEIEYRVQSEIMLLAAEDIRDHVYSDSINVSGIIYTENSIKLPKRLKARAGGVITVTGTVNPGSYSVSEVSDDGLNIIVNAQLTAGTDSAKALVEFDGSGCELIAPAPWSEIYYDYLLMKLSEHLEESSEQNNRAITFNKAFTRFMRWWADNYTPADGRAIFRGYYLKGDPGVRGDPGHTPVRGTDYWTASDIAAVESYIDSKVDAIGGCGTVLIAGSYNSDDSITITTPNAFQKVWDAVHGDTPKTIVLDIEYERFYYVGMNSITIDGNTTLYAFFTMLSYGFGAAYIQLKEDNTATGSNAFDGEMYNDSVNAVQSKVIKAYVDEKTANNKELYLSSPNDTLYKITVSDTGELNATAVE